MQDKQDKQDIKVCKDCKYWDYEYSTNICKHDLAVIIGKEVNRVNGSVSKPMYRECGYMRYVGKCSEEGKLFEEREDLVYKVIKFFKKVKS